MEVTSEMESLDLCMHFGTCIGSCGVCSDIIVLNTRKHTWFDHSQSTCYYYTNIQLIRIQHRSLHDYNIHHLQHSAIAELQLLRVFAAHPVCSVLVQARDEGLPEIAKMAGKCIVVWLGPYFEVFSELILRVSFAHHIHAVFMTRLRMQALLIFA